MVSGLVVAVVLTAAAVYVGFCWYQQRASFKGLPQPPGHEFVFGHAKVIDALSKRMPPGIHPHTYAYELRRQYNLPKAFYVDLWPFSAPWLVITDTELAEQVTTRPSLPKFSRLRELLSAHAGTRNLVVMEGDEWKRWRAVFNPGFSTTNLAKNVPAIVHETQKFCDFLSAKAESGETFEMEPKAVDLTVEIIGHVILSQSYKKTFRDQVYWVSLGSHPGLKALRTLDPYRYFKMWWNEIQMNKWIRQTIQERWEQRLQDPTRVKKSQFVIDIAIDAYLADKKQLGQDASAIDEEYMEILQDMMKVFIFGGHDTSSGTICYVLWNLRRHPEWLQRLRAEYDSVFGAADTSPAATGAQISARPTILNELPATTAVIRETLRLFPPASTVRSSLSDYPIVDAETGQTFQTHGYMVWVPSFGIMRDPKYFPDPHAFRPERFLRGHKAFADLTSDPVLEAATPHPHAWRPFEVGPRNCIGQELAMMEIKIFMALALRRFEFVPAYGESVKVDPKFDWVGGQAYPVLFGTAKPNGGMPVSVKERKS